MIPVYDAEQAAMALPFDQLIPSIRKAFQQGANVPLRHHHHIPQDDGSDAVLLLMLAWQEQGGVIGVKLVTIFPGNQERQLPGLHSTYMLLNGTTGAPLAIIDGNQITVRRTVAVAALAASILAREDAKRMLVVGAGRVGRMSPYAFTQIRSLEHIEVWDREQAYSLALVSELNAAGMSASVAEDMEPAVRRADIITCATLSTEPLIKCEWLSPGTHLDLIGSFTPHMREADDDCIAKGIVFIDSPDALEESGDLIDPIAKGIFKVSDVRGTLSDLCVNETLGRRSQDEITIFKAVGTGLSDLAAGALAYERLRQA